MTNIESREMTDTEMIVSIYQQISEITEKVERMETAVNGVMNNPMIQSMARTYGIVD